MSFKCLIFLFLTIVFFSCKKPEFSKNQLFLIQPDKEHKVLDLHLNKHPDSLFVYIKEQLGNINLCYKRGYFGFKIDNLIIKSTIKKRHCSLGIYTYNPLRLDLNSQKTVLINSHEFIKLDSISKWFKTNYPNSKKHDSFIKIYWSTRKHYEKDGIKINTKKMEIETIHYFIKQVVKGYLEGADKISLIEFHKKISELDSFEISKLKKMIPFNLELGILTPVIPPPPNIEYQK